MLETGKPSERRRRDWVIILIILLFGFLCVILAGQWAIRFSPNWKLDTSMESNLNPDSKFLTSRPVSYIEPLDPSILTQPVWVNVYLTPGASFQTRTPAPITSPMPNTPVITRTAVPPTQATPSTITPTIPIATKTSVYVPPTSTPTPVTVTPPTADLQITVTDGVTTYMAGSVVNYTITISNNGPGNITGATLSDNKPSQVANWIWTCTNFNGASGCDPVSSSSNFSDVVNLPSGGSITYIVTSYISVSATGNLSNTALISLPVSATDPNTGNNSATDIDTLFTPSADLQVVKSDGVNIYNGGDVLTYTITVSNAGPNAVTGATVSDTKPSQIANWSWTCVNNSGASGCNTASLGTANFTDTIDLPSGSNIVYTVTANVVASPVGTLTNTATINVPTGYNDPISSNNTATDTDTLSIPPISTDLQITKTDGVTTYTSHTGSDSVTYTIVVTNNSPSSVTGATVTDTFPTQISSATWTCSGVIGSTCTASGSGNISDTVSIPAGGNVTYTVTANITSGATGNLDNTATVSVPTGYVDSAPLNNTATDPDTRYVPQANLSVTKDDGALTYIAGGQNTYTITVINSGPDDVVGATVTDTIPSQITNWSWACTSQLNGASGCDTFSGSTDFTDLGGINLPNGASITYTVTANISPTATGPGSLDNTVDVGVPSLYSDPFTSNNSALDSDTYALSADLSIIKTDGATTYPVGGNVTYTITVTNNGPDDVTGATLSDIKPSRISTWGWCAAPCVPTASTSADLSDTINLTSGSSVTYNLLANFEPDATGSLANTASVTAPSSVIDPVTSNNSATDTDTPVRNVDLQITKDDGVTTYIPGSSITYTITVSNAGPANVTGATVTDTFAAGVSANWSCIATGGATCTASGGGNINDTVNVPVGGSLTYTVTANIASSRTGDLSNTATVNEPSGYNDTLPANKFATDTDTQNSVADLSITITDNSSGYTANALKLLPNVTPYAYTITVSNAGPSDVSGATVSNVFSNGNATSIGWTCTPSAGATCPPLGASDLNNVSVDLDSGASVTFYLAAQVVSSPSGDLVNDVSVTSSLDTATSTDTDTLITPDTPPGGVEIGPGNNTGYTFVPADASVILDLGTTITTDGNSDYDLVFYERPAGTGIFMDHIQVEVSDGSNWYTVLYWGGAGDADTNTSISVPLNTFPNPTDCSGEPDNCEISTAYLWNSGTVQTGIRINIDIAGVPNGINIRYIRITSLNTGDGDGADLDSIEILP